MFCQERLDNFSQCIKRDMREWFGLNARVITDNVDNYDVFTITIFSDINRIYQHDTFNRIVDTTFRVYYDRFTIETIHKTNDVLVLLCNTKLARKPILHYNRRELYYHNYGGQL